MYRKSTNASEKELDIEKQGLGTAVNCETKLILQKSKVVYLTHDWILELQSYFFKIALKYLSLCPPSFATTKKCCYPS
jgi:hypothetical protein